MVQSNWLKENPNLFVFLPLFYVVWSDNVLSDDELNVLQHRISRQKWLSESEKDFLFRQINPQNPPTPNELKQWLETVHKVPLSPADSLAEIGRKTVAFYAGKNPDADVIRALEGIEDELGFIGREATYAFHPEFRHSITQQLRTRETFDVQRMTQLLEGADAPLIHRVKQIISSPEFAYIETDNLNEYREQILSWAKILAREGLGAIAYPKEYGGQNDMAAYFTVMETLSYHDLSLVVKFGVQFGLWGMSVYFLGTEKHHKKYLKDIGTLTLPGCFAMTETGHGSNVRGIETTATYNHADRTFIIHTPNPLAQKEYIGNAALHGRMATVFAKLIINGTDYGVNAFIVPLRDENGNVLPGITIKDCGRKLGLNGVDNGIIRFEHVLIPKDNMLDRFAKVNDKGEFESPITSDNRRFFTMLGTLVGGRIGIPRSGNAASKSALTIAIRYGDKRTQFGPEGAPEVPILNYRTHQRRLIPLLANAYALHFALQYLTKRFINRTEKEMQEIEALAAGLKAWGTWNTTATIQECREACGGKGYLFENRLGTLKNDTDIYTTFEGDNTVLMQLVAKSRLTEFKQEFSSMNAFGLLNYLAGQAATAITEMNPLIVRNTDETHLLDPEFHLNAFRYRERDILISAARRLKRHIDSGMDSFDAFNVCQHHLVQAGFAYIERIILEQFLEAVEQAEDDGCKTVLKQLYRIFALNLLDKHKGWYLEQGYMEGVKTKAIRKLLNQLCWEVRQDAVPLVNAFAIPDACLAAPIALS
ncbi:MAG: acyl-CoA dehydrogenase family protein [Cyclobacteriaceae bacterium]|nr:acyl-CoA dehydrogenase family protein [Cyclobacteriaceae bacterium]MCX7636303.1 acyl-CoA dehydrogenase family protein [Cyclobacteriaceae bacterium]MDW8330880.1 acyl-CoA dehydrogenase [Cyclobacteriaceae bacterium]